MRNRAKEGIDKLFANDKGGQSLKTLPALLAKYRQLVRLAIVQLITKAKIFVVDEGHAPELPGGQYILFLLCRFR